MKIVTITEKGICVTRHEYRLVLGVVICEGAARSREKTWLASVGAHPQDIAEYLVAEYGADRFMYLEMLFPHSTAKPTDLPLRELPF